MVVTTSREGGYAPHGDMDGLNIFRWGRPDNCTADNQIELEPSFTLSTEADMFLSMLGPLDWEGWAMLAGTAPVHGWPSGEIIAAIADTPDVAACVPIDRLGMLTNRNPNGLYIAPSRAGEHPSWRNH